MNPLVVAALRAARRAAELTHHDAPQPVVKHNNGPSTLWQRIQRWLRRGDHPHPLL
jgi:hypothetical protein